MSALAPMGYVYRCASCGKRCGPYSEKPDQFATCGNQDCLYDAMSDKADMLTEANRVELAGLVQVDQERFAEAFADWCESGDLDFKEIGRLLWNERQHEKTEFGDTKVLDGRKVADCTDLARWTKDCAERYAKDNAERVDSEDLIGADDGAGEEK